VGRAYEAEAEGTFKNGLEVTALPMNVTYNLCGGGGRGSKKVHKI